MFSVLNKLFDLAPPLLIGLAVDIVVERQGSWIASLGVVDLRDQLLVLAAATAVIWILESVFEYLFEVRWRNLAQTVQHELRVDAYRHVQGLEQAYFEDRSTGGLLAVLNDDVNQLERFLDRGANEIIQVLTTVVVISSAFFIVAPDIAVFAMAPIPVIVWGTMRFQRVLEPRYAAVRAQVGHLNASLANNLSGIATIKAFTAERREVDRITADSQVYRERNAEAIRYSSMFVPLIRMAILVGFMFILVLGGLRVLDGQLGVGTYSVGIFIVQRLLWPLTRLGETFDLYQRAMASTRRILDLLGVRPTITDGPEALRAAFGELELRDVRFAYKDGLEVLHGLDLHIPAGQTTAIVGATGAGKSTIVKLLLRLYDPQDGSVCLDGVDIRRYRLDDLRDVFGLVNQDVYLFHGTVRENIVYGRPDATDDQVVAAARLAEAHDFIAALPKGYDTVVGERGQKLSGGQRQRVCIARAILADPVVLLLDEATSAVDNETEAAIQRSLVRVSEGRTTVVIAHRLSTIRHADAIHVMDAGRIVESGTHEQLLTRDGLYAALWRVQAGESVVR
ncbi:MAG TPA: ABC transporter ATP-binding protein [Egibacteraceae bacterium]|nr:ABC transporter ATP-binding protein [Egibacteraceae bacterium]